MSPSTIPDYAIELLEIRENLDRQELTTKEKTAHTHRLAAIMKEHGIMTETNSDGNRHNSRASSNGVGAPVTQGVKAAITQETGIDRNTLNTRLKAAEPITGPIDFEHATPEEHRDAADKLQESAAQDKDAKALAKISPIRPNPKDPTALLDWIIKRSWTAEDVDRYIEALQKHRKGM